MKWGERHKEQLANAQCKSENPEAPAEPSFKKELKQKPHRPYRKRNPEIKR